VFGGLSNSLLENLSLLTLRKYPSQLFQAVVEATALYQPYDKVGEAFTVPLKGSKPLINLAGN